MTAWTNDELEKIGAADELQLTSRWEDSNLAKAGHDLVRVAGAVHT